MATNFSNALIPRPNVAPSIHDVANFIHTTLVAGGWIIPTDTGQLDLTSSPITTTYPQTVGYRLYKTADALTPVYVRLDYGTPNHFNYFFGLFVTIGTGLSGGMITGVLLSQINVSSLNSLTASVCNFGAAGNNWFSFVLFPSIYGAGLAVAFERRRTLLQADADTGIVLNCRGYISAGTSIVSANLCKSYLIPFTGSAPTPENGFATTLSSNNPSQVNGVIYGGLIRPIFGTEDPPCLGFAMCNSLDLVDYFTVIIAINGVNHTYRQCGPNISSLRSGGSDANTRLLMRWE